MPGSASQLERRDRLVLGARFGQRALLQPNIPDAERPEVRVGLADDALDEILPARVVHPRDRDVRRELVVVALEAERGEFF